MSQTPSAIPGYLSSGLGSATNLLSAYGQYEVSKSQARIAEIQGDIELEQAKQQANSAEYNAELIKLEGDLLQSDLDRQIAITEAESKRSLENQRKANQDKSISDQRQGRELRAAQKVAVASSGVSLSGSSLEVLMAQSETIQQNISDKERAAAQSMISQRMQTKYSVQSMQATKERTALSVLAASSSASMEGLSALSAGKLNQKAAQINASSIQSQGKTEFIKTVSSEIQGVFKP